MSFNSWQQENTELLEKESNGFEKWRHENKAGTPIDSNRLQPQIPSPKPDDIVATAADSGIALNEAEQMLGLFGTLQSLPDPDEPSEHDFDFSDKELGINPFGYLEVGQPGREPLITSNILDDALANNAARRFSELAVRSGKQIWNKTIGELSKGAGTPEDVLSNKAFLLQQERIESRDVKLPTALLDDEFEDIKRQLAESPEVREDEDLKEISYQYEPKKQAIEFDIAPSETLAEKAVDIAAGVGGFMTRLAILRKFAPTAPPTVIWEGENIASGGRPGMGMGTRAMLGAIGEIPTGKATTKIAKVGAEMGLFGGLTAIQGGSTEDIIISSLIPAVFNGYHFAQQRKALVDYRLNMLGAAQDAHNVRMRHGMPRATSEAHFKADLRVIDKNVAKTKQAIYKDDAFAPAKEKWEAQRQKALKMVKQGGKVGKRGQNILDFLDSRKKFPDKPVEQQIKEYRQEAKQAARELDRTPKEELKIPIKKVKPTTEATKPSANAAVSPVEPSKPKISSKVAPEAETGQIEGLKKYTVKYRDWVRSQAKLESKGKALDEKDTTVDKIERIGNMQGREVVEITTKAGKFLFYRSAKGTSGKSIGTWYPLAGIADKGGKSWFIKTDDIKQFYGSKKFRAISKQLEQAEKSVNIPAKSAVPVDSKTVNELGNKIAKFLGYKKEIVFTFRQGKRTRGTANAADAISTYIKKGESIEEVERMLIHEIGHLLKPSEGVALSVMEKVEREIRKFTIEKQAELGFARQLTLAPAGQVETKQVKSKVQKETTPTERVIREDLLDTDVDLSIMDEAVKAASTTKDVVRSKSRRTHGVVTRFLGLEAQVRKALIEVEEQEREIPKRSAKDSFAKYGKLSDTESLQVMQHLDNPAEYPDLSEKLQRVANMVRQENSVARDILQELGYEADWPNNRIRALGELLDKTENKKTKQKIADAIDKLSGLGYVHRVYIPESLLKKVWHWSSRKKISSRPTGLLGRKLLTLDDAIEAGKKPAHIAIAQADMMAIARKAKLHAALINSLNSNIDIALPDNLALEGWVSIDTRLMPAAKGFKYHPDIAEALTELTWTSNKHTLTKIYDKINSSLKHLMFYNPLIMTKNDLFQGWRATGLGFVGKLPRAIYIVATKNATYHKMRKSALYNGVIDYSPAVNALVQNMIDTARTRYGVRFSKHIASWLNPVNIVSDVYKMNNATTWKLDEVLRTAVALDLLEGSVMSKTLNKLSLGVFPESFKKRLGLTDFETIEMANDFMANYGKVPKQTRQVLNRVMFTPTYRISMTRMLAKMHANPAKFAPQLARHYAYKLFLRFVLPGLTAMWVCGRDWEEGKLEKGYRVVVDRGDGTEIVFSLSDPLLEENKAVNRKILKTLEYNLAALPYAALNLFRPSKWKRKDYDRFGHLFKLGTPIVKDIGKWADQDFTTAEKFINQLAIAYTYSRQKGEAAEETALESTLRATALYIDWKMRIGEIDAIAGTNLKVSLLNKEEAEKEYNDSIYESEYKRSDGMYYPAGHAHKGKEDYVKALKKRIDSLD